MSKGNEIVVYQPNATLQLQVRLENETVWLSIDQMAELFGRDKSVIGKHVRGIFEDGELAKESVWAKNAYTALDGKVYQVDFYNLDVIISVGYRVKSQRGVLFRQWANKVLKDYLLKGYAVNQRFENLEKRVAKTEEQIEFFVHTALPPVEGVFFEGQIFDAYVLASDLIKRATKCVVLIDNYIDESVLTLLDKRKKGVKAVVYTMAIDKQLDLDIKKHNAQYTPIEVKIFTKSHDRFLLIDDEIYHLGASLKDLGKKWFAFNRLTEISSAELLARMEE